MAIKVSSTTVIDDSRNIVNVIAFTASANVAAGNVNLADGTLSRPKIIDYALTHNAYGNAEGTANINIESGNYVSVTATGPVTWVFSNPPASPNAGGLIIELTNGGNFTQTWPNSVAWPSGTAPTLTSNGVDVLTFITDNGGTTWRGSAAGSAAGSTSAGGRRGSSRWTR